MKILHTFIALGILLVLGGVLYYLDKNPPENASDAIPKEKLFSFQAEQVEEISIEMPNEPTLTSRRLPDGERPEAGSEGAPTVDDLQWEFVDPEGVAADSMLIQSFVESLPGLEYTPIMEQTPPSLVDYGLDEPQRVVTIKLQQGKTVTVSIGGENPSGYAKYAMLSSSPGLFLLDSPAFSVLEKTLFDLRDKRALPVALDQAQLLEMDNQTGKIVMTKLTNNNWELTQPAVRTDYAGANYFLTRLIGALMKSIEEEDARSLARYGLHRPQIRLQATLPDGVHSLLVGSDNQDGEGYYAKNSVWPHVFTINQAVYDQLNGSVDEYRNRYLFDFQTTNAQRLEIQTDETNFRFDKQEERWVLRANEDEAESAAAGQSDIGEVDVFLNNIHAMRIQQYTTDRPGRLAQYGLDNPWLRVQITFGEDNREETVLLALQDGKLYAARQGEPSVYELRADEKERIEESLGKFPSAETGTQETPVG